MNLIAQTVADGLVLGGIYALAAVGFSLIFGVLHVINLSHGIIVLMGAYLALIFSETLHIDPLLTMPLVMASLFAVGYVYQRFLIQYAVDSSAFGSILLTFGVALMMHNIMIWVFSPDMKNITPTYAFTSVKLGPIVLDAVPRQLPGGEPGPVELPGCPAEILAARPRHPRHGAADAGGASLRRERPPRLCAHLRVCRRPSPAPRAS